MYDNHSHILDPQETFRLPRVFVSRPDCPAAWVEIRHHCPKPGPDAAVKPPLYWPLDKIRVRFAGREDAFTFAGEPEVRQKMAVETERLPNWQWTVALVLEPDTKPLPKDWERPFLVLETIVRDKEDNWVCLPQSCPVQDPG